MNICFIDFETTGINVFHDKPIQLGAILVDKNLKIIKKFSSDIRIPNNFKISESAKKIHGKTNKDLENAPSTKDLLSNFFSTIGTNYRFAGWNINFDVAFMRKLCNDNNFMEEYNLINHRHIDVQSIAFYLKNKNLINQDLNSLSDYANLLDIKRNNNHYALEDANICLEVYKYIISL